MSTTQLFVELMIIGAGAMIWLVLIIAGIFNIKLDINLLSSNYTYLIPVILAVSYVLGIVIDRTAYAIFRFIDNKHRKTEIDDNVMQEDFARIAERVVLANELLCKKALYNRTRKAICRGWFINFLLIGTSFLFWRIKTYVINPWEIFFIVIVTLIISIWTLIIFIRLSRDYYINIYYSYKYLMKKDN